MVDGAGERAEGLVIRPSPALTVTVWPGRLELPALGGRVVGRPELELIQTFAQGRHRTIDEAAAVATGDPHDDPAHDLARRLLLRGGLVKVDPSRIAAPGDRAPRTAGRVDPVAHVRLETPLSVHPREDRFEIVGHDGAVLVELSLDELLALPALATPVDLAELAATPDGPSRLTTDELGGLCARLIEVRLMTTVDPGTPGRALLAPDDAEARVRLAFAAAAERADRLEREREQRTGERRTRVVPVSFTSGPPLALGLIFAHCLAHDGGRLTDRFEFRLDWEWNDDRLDASTAYPAVFMGSAYVWSHVEVLRVVRAAKERNPAALVVVGGPDAPKRESDARAYLDAHPEVDVLVRGEGEQTALELLDALVLRPDGSFDLAGLAEVAGLTLRLGGEVVRTADRERLTDLDVIPSPFLTGLFDTYLDAPLHQVILETNRGCPYGCTFCDWGSATQSRIRKFDLDRVFGEIDWSARARATVVSLADANFGIFPRDVEIAERVASVRAETSYPGGFGANFAKNTVKHLGPIIRTLVEAGIVNRGLLALQTMDGETLDTIARSNIKVERYDAIATEMRAAGLPFAVELMMGLPGATPDSFKNDLQQCIDREVEGTVNPTTVLVNSPMNAPAYRAQHGIETAAGIGPGNHALVVSTSSFTREEYQRMRVLRRAFLLAENFGVTRHIDRLVRHSTGVREIDFLERLRADVVDDPGHRDRHPFLRLLFGQSSPALVTPLSWRFLVDDLVSYVREVHPDIDPAALGTVARVQHAVLPAFDRDYPVEVALDHDYPRWFSLVVDAKERGHHDDWTDLVPPLTSFGPGTLHVDDPNRHARNHIGCSVDHGPLLATWEHHSEVGRALFLADTST